MSAETKRILDLLKEGKINAEDAEKLLDKLSGTGTNQASSTWSEAAPGEKTGGDAGSTRKPRFLRIVVEKPGHDHVNMRVPLSLVRTSKLMALIPPRVTERLAEQGIDLAGFASMEDFAEAVEKTNIDIDKGNGKKVRIFCE
jgi:SHOCT-like protein